MFPGIQGLGYAEWVTPEQRASYEAAIRAEGFPKFKIRPAGQRSPYTSITFLEPFDERNKQAFGYDMYSNEMRRNAMNLARDTGRVSISGRVRLVQEIKGKVQAGFLMYLPYYKGAGPFDTVEKRRAASKGFVYSPFRMDDLMKGILGLGLPNVHLQIFDGKTTTPDSLMYNSAPESTHAAPIFADTLELLMGQHYWTVKITSLPPFETLLDPVKSYATLFAGVLTSLLFFGVLWSFATTRQRAQVLAAKMTVALEEHANELIRSNEELESFAYVASHDLKAPLRGIDNLATWIEEDLGENLKGESRENMNLLRGRIKRLEALLSDLLTFSRAGQGEVPTETVNLNELISDSFDLLNVDRKFELQLSAPVEPIKIIKTALEQVIGNIFSNALKHHDTGDGHLFVNVRELDESYEFTIADDGPGIPSEHRERVFKMFHTLQPRDTVEGSGIGLAIIRRIVEKQGGKIFLEDRADGKGALFRFHWNKTD